MSIQCHGGVKNAKSTIRFKIKPYSGFYYFSATLWLMLALTDETKIIESIGHPKGHRYLSKFAVRFTAQKSPHMVQTSFSSGSEDLR